MTTPQLEQRFQDVRSEAEAMLSRQGLQAEAEGRDRTPSERAAVEAKLNEARTLRQRLDRAQGDENMRAELDRLTGGAVPQGQGRRGLSIGAQFIASDTFKWLRDTKNTRAGQWSSPASELWSATITGAPTSGGGLVVPDYQTDIIPLPSRPLVVADLMAPGTTNSNSVVTMKETSVVNAAAAVAEGAAKPESTIVFAAVTDAVRKIATWIPVSEEMFEDVPSLQAYLDSRLRLFVQLAEDDQLLNGDGVAPNILGVLHRPGLTAPLARVDPQNNADVILKQISAVEAASNLAVDGIVMHPNNWDAIALLKDTTGAYIAGGGPFASPQQKTLWGRPVSLTPAIVAGTGLVGAFKSSSQFFRRGGLRVDASNSHQDFFTKNLVAVRAEERGALAVYREAAFGTVTLLT